MKNKQIQWHIFACAILTFAGYALPWIGGKTGIELIRFWFEGFSYLLRFVEVSQEDALRSLFNGNPVLKKQLFFLLTITLPLLLSLITMAAALLTTEARVMAAVTALTIWGSALYALLQLAEVIGLDRTIQVATTNLQYGAYLVLLGSLGLILASTNKWES